MRTGYAGPRAHVRIWTRVWNRSWLDAPREETRRRQAGECLDAAAALLAEMRLRSRIIIGLRVEWRQQSTGWWGWVAAVDGGANSAYNLNDARELELRLGRYRAELP